MPDTRLTLANGIADAFLAGDWEPAAMARRAQRAVGHRRVWLRDLAVLAYHGFPSPPHDRRRELARFLSACEPLRTAVAKGWQRSSAAPGLQRRLFPSTSMGERRWPVAEHHTVKDLQSFLGLSAADLLWYADTKALERYSAGRLRHYRYRWVPKRAGGARLIEEPKPMLKHFQRVLLRDILDHIPSHGAARAFRPGGSVLTYARGHAGQAVVVHLDLENFFGSVVAGRVFGIFKSAGYPEAVAHLLTGLVTNSVPAAVVAQAPTPAPAALYSFRRQVQCLAHPHLPQGAPTSPCLANLAALGLDRRLSGLAQAMGWTYSRYADDLAWSAPERINGAIIHRLVSTVAHMTAEEGFRLNTAKTLVMRAGNRQRLAGIVVNDHPNTGRREYETLKAVLHNTAVYGPASQNRDPSQRLPGAPDRSGGLGQARQPSPRAAAVRHP